LNPRKATSFDITQITSLWKSVFFDSDDFVNRFITHFGIECCYVCEINGKIAAMAFALPTNIEFNDLKIQKFKNLKSQISPELNSGLKSLLYLYACATLPQYRGQGVMAKLLETIYEEACREDVAGIFLYAADQKLEEYYRKLGFVDFFYRGCSEVFNHKEHKEGAKGAKKFITPKIYYQKRLQKLESYCFVNWDESFFNFLYETGIQFCEYENYFFSLRIENENIIIDELLGDAPKEQIAQHIFNHFPDCKTVEINYPGNSTSYGQIKWCTPKNKNLDKGYFAFAMV